MDIAIHIRNNGTAATTYASLQHSKSGTNGPDGSAQFNTLIGTSTAFNTTVATTLHLDWQNTATTPALVVQTASLEVQL